MKKLLILFLTVVMLTGCSKKSENTSLFIEKNNKYALCYNDDLKTKFVYDAYEEVGTNGYVVHNGKKDSYLLSNGKTKIAYKKGVTLKAVANMIVAKNKKDVYTIYDSDGKKMYQSSKKDVIKVYGLPVIKSGKTYKVLDSNGEVILKTKDKVTYADTFGTSLTVVSKKDSVLIFDSSTDSQIDKKGLEIAVKGKFSIVDQNYQYGYLLYDQKDMRFVYADVEGKVMLNKTLLLDSAKLTKNTIYVTVGNTTEILSLDGSVNTIATSYYLDSENYLVKNESYVYGPHTFVNKGETKEVKGIQLNPAVSKTNGKIFPVYVQNKGYRYYNYAGKKVFKEYFKSAGDFDSNKLAVVSKDGEKYYLIDQTGNKVSKKYVKIDNIGNGYYAAFESSTKYIVINTSGEKVVNDYFMGEGFTYVYENSTYGVFNKSGTTHVIDMNEGKEKFSLNGEYKLYKDTYLVSANGKKYYDLKGDKVYKG